MKTDFLFIIRKINILMPLSILLIILVSTCFTACNDYRVNLENIDPEDEELQEYTGMLGEFTFTSGENETSATGVNSGITISSLAIGNLESEYTNDALELSDWVELNVGAGKWIGFEINGVAGYEYEVDSVTVVIRRSDNIPNRTRLSYGDDKPNSTQHQGVIAELGTSNYDTYSLEVNADRKPDHTTPYYAIGISADSRETTVEFDKISIYGSIVEVPTEITVNTDMAIHSIGDQFWGTNLLYWIEDDAALDDGKIADSLKDMGIQVLRYPGGTVADNFHWKTNTLENINMFPYESGAAETDFDEFMMQCQKIGAKPSLVLNTESWAVKKDIPGGAHEAANWLRYSKSKGYEVASWEVGNETYWHPVLSAKEYADLVNVYADSLRKVDPDVVIGVNGHWNKDFVSTKERVRPEEYEQLMDYRRNIDSRAANEQYKDFKKSSTRLPVTLGDTKWWETVAELCGANVDMVIIHWYFSPGQLSNVSQKLLEVRGVFAQKHPGKNYVFNMNEYNVTSRSAESHMHLTEMIGAMLKGKIEMTAFWPMRMRNSNKPRLLDYETNRPTIMFEIHKYLAENLKGMLVESDAPAIIPAFASKEGEKCTVVFTGSKLSAPTDVTINIAGQTPDSCRVWRISGSEFEYEKSDESIPVDQQKITIRVEPDEVVVAVFE